MKTRVIQDEPEPGKQPSTHADLASAQMQPGDERRRPGWAAGARTHWKTAVFGWLGSSSSSFAFGNMRSASSRSTSTTPASASRTRPTRSSRRPFPNGDPQTEFVLVQSTTPDGRRPGVPPDGRRRRSRRLASSPDDQEPATRPYDAGNASLISHDRHAAHGPVGDRRATPTRRKRRSTTLAAATATVAKAASRRSTSGNAGVSSDKALDKTFTDQLQAAGERSIPITIVVLLLVLGALVAVGMPILLALTGVSRTIGLVGDPEPARSRWTRTSTR